MLKMWLVKGTLVTPVEVKDFEVFVPGIKMQVRPIGCEGPWREVGSNQLYDTRADAEQNVKEWLERKQQQERSLGLPRVGGYRSPALRQRYGS
jgi:hypothetical protein